jgi:hypothetical protein
METHLIKSPVEGVIGLFAIHGACLESRPYDSGYINDTFATAVAPELAS